MEACIADPGHPVTLAARQDGGFALDALVALLGLVGLVVLLTAAAPIHEPETRTEAVAANLQPLIKEDYMHRADERSHNESAWPGCEAVDLAAHFHNPPDGFRISDDPEGLAHPQPFLLFVETDDPEAAPTTRCYIGLPRGAVSP